MKKVIIESPFRGETAYQLERNRIYAKECMKDSILRNEAPYLSHLLFTQVLNDDKPEERTLGIELGLFWGECADLTAVYTDNGITEGMRYGIEDSIRHNRPIDYRTLPEKSELLDCIKKRDLNTLLEGVSQHFEIPVFDLKSISRKRELVEARQVFFKVATELFPLNTLECIGSMVNRDHCTVLHGIAEVVAVKEKRIKYQSFVSSSNILLCLPSQQN